jgi:acyl-CoA thioester hydrolase
MHAEPSRPFRYCLRVRYGECDAQKVVFNARYADYVDLAALEFMRAIGFADALMTDLDYQLVKLTLEWKAPARFDQTLELTASSETVYVLVDARTLLKTPIPPEFRAALERGAPGAVTDHAGHLHETQAPARESSPLQ